MTARDGRADCVRTAEAETLQIYTTSTLRQTKGDQNNDPESLRKRLYCLYYHMHF